MFSGPDADELEPIVAAMLFVDVSTTKTFVNPIGYVMLLTALYETD